MKKQIQEAKQDMAMDTYSLRMTAWHARQARKLSGTRELAEGIRIAIEMAVKAKEGK